MGVRRRPGEAWGVTADRPLPHAPSGDPTPITLSVMSSSVASPEMVLCCIGCVVAECVCS